MQAIEEWIENKDVGNLCKALFDAEIRDKPGQKEIVKNIAFKQNKRLCITAFTRYGKTYAVALGTALYLFLRKDKVVNEIAPVQKQSKKFRQYLIEFVLECDPLREMLDVNASGIERIKKEVSKKRVTFRDGNEINILTAGGSNEAQSLMGSGGDLIIEDESCDISADIYRKRISRMLGDNPDSVLVEIGNPWHKDNHFYEHWKSERFKNIQVSWKQGLKEDRITKEFIEEKKEELTDTEFQVLYKSEFPDSVEQGLIKHSWIEEAKDREFNFENDEKIIGVDVAERGNDKTVMTTTYQEANRVRVTNQDSWGNLETMQTSDKIDNSLKGYEYLNVDAIGVGSGVASRLKQKGFDVYSVKVSERSDSDRFLNKKSEYYWKLRNLFEDGRISLGDNISNKLETELTQIRYEINSSGKIKIIDPDKSPDFADSLMLACCINSASSGSGSVSIL